VSVLISIFTERQARNDGNSITFNDVKNGANSERYKKQGTEMKSFAPLKGH